VSPLTHGDRREKKVKLINQAALHECDPWQVKAALAARDSPPSRSSTRSGAPPRSPLPFLARPDVRGNLLRVPTRVRSVTLSQTAAVNDEAQAVPPLEVGLDFSTYVRTRSAGLVRAAYLLTGDRQLAEDLAQTALAKVSLRWEVVSGRGDPDAYVRKAMVRTAIGWRRRRWHGERPTALMPEVAEVDSTIAVDARHRMRAALLSLPPRQRATVVLRFYEDLSEADTALTLGCSVGAVKSQTARGLAKLRQFFDARPLS
jgi:RNA polymerase sigma-70 factor (sigma-E family)